MTSIPFQQLGRVSFIGVAKNCGKTTALIASLALAHEAGLNPGLVSIGVDGEPHDLLIGTPKPTIAARPGQWLVSAADALTQSTARVEFVRPLGWSGPMGEVVLARVLSPGDVMLAGIRHMRDLALAEAALASVGAAPVFIDGAYGRVASAFTDGAILVATGAIVSPSPAELLQITSDLIDRLTLAPIPDAYVEAAHTALATDHTHLIRADHTTRATKNASALLALSRERHIWDEDIAALVIPGLVSDRVLEELLAAPRRADAAPRTLILSSGAALQGAPRLWRRLLRGGWRITAQTRSELVAIAVNPTSITGQRIDPDALIPPLRARYPGVAVFDPRGGA